MNNRLKIPLSERQYDKLITTIAKKGSCTKKNLANYIEVPQSSISLWIREKFIPAKHFKKVYEFFEIEAPKKRITS